MFRVVGAGASLLALLHGTESQKYDDDNKYSALHLQSTGWMFQSAAS